MTYQSAVRPRPQPPATWVHFTLPVARAGILARPAAEVDRTAAAQAKPGHPPLADLWRPS